MNYQLIPDRPGEQTPDRLASARPADRPSSRMRRPHRSAQDFPRHCCLALAYDRVLIRDLGSHNGLRVNGRPVEEARLYPGDEVAIGPLIYRMEMEPPPRARPGRCPAPGAAPEPGQTAAVRGRRRPDRHATIPTTSDGAARFLLVHDSAIIRIEAAGSVRFCSDP